MSSQGKTEKVQNSQRIQELQCEVLSIRTQAPDYICAMMEKERQMKAEILVSFCGFCWVYIRLTVILNTEKLRISLAQET
jgi:hypothetical protein